MRSSRLLGANGAGKTTLLRAISGLLEVHRGEMTKGSVIFDQEPVDHGDPAKLVRAGVAQVMEGRRIFAELTVEENLRAGAYTVRDKDAVAAAHERVMDLFPVLKPRQRDTAGYLSGGEQQMLAIGRALMASPRPLAVRRAVVGVGAQARRADLRNHQHGQRAGHQCFTSRAECTHGAIYL